MKPTTTTFSNTGIRCIVIFMTLSLGNPTNSEEAPTLRPNIAPRVILDPSIGRRCEALLSERRTKLLRKNRILQLMEKNSILQKKTPAHKKSILEKLVANHGELSNELTIVKTQIESDEENIVRKGCPGIQL
jgi:hypothetical protein